MERPAQAKLSRAWSAWCEVCQVCGEVKAHVKDSHVHRWCDTGLSVCDVSRGWTEVRHGMLCVGAVRMLELVASLVCVTAVG